MAIRYGKQFLAIAALSGALLIVRSEKADALPCSQKCSEITDPGGHVLGYACLSGFAGFGCQAGTWYCFINLCGYASIETAGGRELAMVNSCQFRQQASFAS